MLLLSGGDPATTEAVRAVILANLDSGYSGHSEAMQYAMIVIGQAVRRMPAQLYIERYQQGLAATASGRPARKT